MSRNLTIILRTCTVVQAASNSDRYINLPKHEIVKVCVSSLVNSINNVKNHYVRLIVLDDHSSPEAVEDIKQILSHCKFHTEFIPVTTGTGNGYTMKQVYNQVEQKATDLWYHVEDDYLHIPTAIEDMIETIEKFEPMIKRMVAINPHDDIWRYTKQVYDSIILLGPHRHYRTVKHTTYTCMASVDLYKKYKDVFQELVTLTTNKEGWVEDRTINTIWSKNDVALFSPIPGVGFHMMDESGRDPYVDIMKLWNDVPKFWLKEKNESL